MPQTGLYVAGGGNRRPAPAKGFQDSASPWAVISPWAKLPPPTRVNSGESTPLAGRPLAGDISATSKFERVEVLLKMEANTWNLPGSPNNKLKATFFYVRAWPSGHIKTFHDTLFSVKSWNRQWNNDILGHTCVHCWLAWEEFIPTGS